MFRHFSNFVQAGVRDLLSRQVVKKKPRAFHLEPQGEKRQTETRLTYLRYLKISDSLGTHIFCFGILNSPKSAIGGNKNIWDRHLFWTWEF